MTKIIISPVVQGTATLDTTIETTIQQKYSNDIPYHAFLAHLVRIDASQPIVSAPSLDQQCTKVDGFCCESYSLSALTHTFSLCLARSSLNCCYRFALLEFWSLLKMPLNGVTLLKKKS